MGSSRPPIIFVGMHRSGSSLLGRLMRRFGLFTGAWQDENGEAHFFLESNKRLLASCGARWDEPGAAADEFRDTGAVKAASDHAAKRLSSLYTAAFLGPIDFLRYRSILRLDRPWGWKDPRNTFTFPVWHKVFPAARVLRIERHGVDVAQSLEARSQRTAGRFPWSGRSAASPRCSTLEGGLSLWAEYQAQADSLLDDLSPDRVHTVQYEQLLQQPAKELRSAAIFCDLQVPDSDVVTATATIRAERAYAYRRDERLAAFAREHESTLAKWGYSA